MKTTSYENQQQSASFLDSDSNQNDEWTMTGEKEDTNYPGDDENDEDEDLIDDEDDGLTDDEYQENDNPDNIENEDDLHEIQAGDDLGEPDAETAKLTGPANDLIAQPGSEDDDEDK